MHFRPQYLVSAVLAFAALPASAAVLDNVTTSVLDAINLVSTANFGCPQIAPGPVTTYSLAGSFPAPVLTDATSIEAIRQTLAIYALAIDGRNFQALTKVFATNARANYSDPIGVLVGVQNIISTLAPGLLEFASTQHFLGTQYIDICSLTTAVSVTYFQASHFFVPYTGIANTINGSQVLIDKSQYQDTWARQTDGTWKITNRNLVRMVSSSATNTRESKLLTSFDRVHWRLTVASQHHELPAESWSHGSAKTVLVSYDMRASRQTSLSIRVYTLDLLQLDDNSSGQDMLLM
jgi:hypothetical protein